jgi:hypothetical protein
MICEIALDGATKQLQDQDEFVSKDYKILKKTKCKGEKPAVLPMKSDAKFVPEG